jgi:hypothetical protein
MEPEHDPLGVLPLFPFACSCRYGRPVLRAVLLGAVCAAVLAAGCGGGDKPTTTAAKATTAASPSVDPVIGSWKGTGTERSADGRTRTYPVSMAIATLDRHASAGRIDYSSFPCGGTVRYVGRQGASYEFRELIHYGKAKCSRNGTITVEVAGDTLHWTWVGEAGLTVEGTLKRS